MRTNTQNLSKVPLGQNLYTKTRSKRGSQLAGSNKFAKLLIGGFKISEGVDMGTNKKQCLDMSVLMKC